MVFLISERPIEMVGVLFMENNNTFVPTFFSQFVREKIVEMSELEFEDWLNAKFPQPPRPVSAPLPRSSGYRY